MTKMRRAPNRRGAPAGAKAVLRLLAVLLAGTTAACTDYRERRETIMLGTGDAVAANRAIHTIDPWSPASRRPATPHDGERIARAVERYRRGPPAGPSGPAALTITPAPAPAPPS